MKNAFSKMESKSNLTDFEDTPKPSTQSNSNGKSSSNSSSSSTSTITSGWRQFSLKSTVHCTGVAAGGAKISIKKSNLVINGYETMTPNGALVRVTTANLAEVLKDLPSNYGKGPLF